MFVCTVRAGIALDLLFQIHHFQAEESTSKEHRFLSGFFVLFIIIIIICPLPSGSRAGLGRGIWTQTCLFFKACFKDWEKLASLDEAPRQQRVRRREEGI